MVHDLTLHYGATRAAEVGRGVLERERGRGGRPLWDSDRGRMRAVKCAVPVCLEVGRSCEQYLLNKVVKILAEALRDVAPWPLGSSLSLCAGSGKVQKTADDAPSCRRAEINTT